MIEIFRTVKPARDESVAERIEFDGKSIGMSGWRVHTDNGAFHVFSPRFLGIENSYGPCTAAELREGIKVLEALAEAMDGETLKQAGGPR